MSRQHGPLRVSALALPTLSSLVFAAALFIGEPPARADMAPLKAPVTVGGPFTLVAADGTTVSDATYRGKWLLVYFGYTLCPDVCPTTLMEIAGALEKLGPDAASLQPLFITVDPERDTPEAIGRYTKAFDSRIAGLTGTAQQIAAVAKEYGAYGMRHKSRAGADDGLMDHSTYLYIMDPRGKFVRGLDFDTPSGRIADTLRELMAVR